MLFNNTNTKFYIASYVVHVQKQRLFGFILKRNVRNFFNAIKSTANNKLSTPTILSRNFYTAHHEVNLTYLNNKKKPKTTTNTTSEKAETIEKENKNKDTESLIKPEKVILNPETTIKENTTNQIPQLKLDENTISNDPKMLQKIVKVYTPTSVNHPKMLTDFAKEHPELFPNGVPKIGLTHKIPSKEFCEKHNLPTIIQTKYAGLDEKGKPHWFVLWNETTPIETILKTQINQQITERLHVYSENVQKVADLEALGRAVQLDKLQATVSPEEFKYLLKLEETIKEGVKKKLESMTNLEHFQKSNIIKPETTKGEADAIKNENPIKKNEENT